MIKSHLAIIKHLLIIHHLLDSSNSSAGKTKFDSLLRFTPLTGFTATIDNGIRKTTNAVIT